MNTLLLQPTDTLFFSDGRPMSGSLAGHTAAWPAPHIVNTALHAALWRSGLAETVHAHRHARHDPQKGRVHLEDRDKNAERFGSLVTAGPFPVLHDGNTSQWFFPTPLDAAAAPGQRVTPQAHCAPLLQQPGAHSHLDKLHLLPVASAKRPDKNKPAAWWNEAAWNAYLHSPNRPAQPAAPDFKNDADFADIEHHIGIGIAPETQTQDGQHFYSAHYLRLRDNCQLGTLAKADDKNPGDKDTKTDLVKTLFPPAPPSPPAGAPPGATTPHIVIGGQQRVCTATRIAQPAGERLPLPLGRRAGFSTADLALPGETTPRPRHLVKWILLTPALWPEITENKPRAIAAHPGGWLPNWIDAATNKVLLRDTTAAASLAAANPRRHGEERNDYRKRLQAMQPAIAATLVAAIVPKPQTVTGWALADERTDDNDAPISTARAKPAHLAVPAGAVYYFACDSAEAAAALAAALNWHGATAGTEIKNRRSTLLGEKGYGIGVCGTWLPHDEKKHSTEAQMMWFLKVYGPYLRPEESAS